MVASALFPYPYSSDVAGPTLPRQAGNSKKFSSTPMHAVSESAVRKSCESRPTTMCSDEREDLSERVVAYLRDRYPSKTGEHVAADIGIKVTTVQKWMERASAPSAVALIKMISFYGPEFLAAVMGDYAPKWLTEKEHINKRAQIEAQLAAIHQELQTL